MTLICHNNFIAKQPPKMLNIFELQYWEVKWWWLVMIWFCFCQKQKWWQRTWILLPIFKETKKRKFVNSTESDEFTSLEPETSFRVIAFCKTLDLVINDLEHRFETVKTICDLFSPILKCLILESKALETASRNLVGKYSSDLSDTFIDEILCRHSLIH